MLQKRDTSAGNISGIRFKGNVDMMITQFRPKFSPCRPPRLFHHSQFDRNSLLLLGLQDFVIILNLDRSSLLIGLNLDRSSLLIGLHDFFIIHI